MRIDDLIDLFVTGNFGTGTPDKTASIEKNLETISKEQPKPRITWNAPWKYSTKSVTSNGYSRYQPTLRSLNAAKGKSGIIDRQNQINEVKTMETMNPREIQTHEASRPCFQ